MEHAKNMKEDCWMWGDKASVFRLQGCMQLTSKKTKVWGPRASATIIPFLTWLHVTNSHFWSQLHQFSVLTAVIPAAATDTNSHLETFQDTIDMCKTKKL